MKKTPDIAFRILGAPPRATGQMRKITITNGKPRFYEPRDVAAAREYFMLNLHRYHPAKPLTGAIRLDVLWAFPTRNKQKLGTWKTTRPDTDNLQKLSKDCMTKSGFWLDDAQVCAENIVKAWSPDPGIYVFAEQMPDKMPAPTSWTKEDFVPYDTGD